MVVVVLLLLLLLLLLPLLLLLLLPLEVPALLVLTPHPRTDLPSGLRPADEWHLTRPAARRLPRGRVGLPGRDGLGAVH